MLFTRRAVATALLTAAAIERAYAAAVGADASYAGCFHHNPPSDTYVTKVGRDAPYSLAELARYVDLTEPPQKKSVPTGIGRNVEIFDRLRRWAYAAVVDLRVATDRAGGVYEAWCRAGGRSRGSDRRRRRSCEPTGAAQVWERERSRQAAEEAARERSRMTREEHVAPARQRHAQAQEMRANGISVRGIACTRREYP